MKATVPQLEQFFKLLTAKRSPRMVNGLTIEVKAPRRVGYVYEAHRKPQGRVSLILYFTPARSDWEALFSRALSAARDIYENKTTAVCVRMKDPNFRPALPAPLYLSPQMLEV
jgi:hypothetical protein